jgi:hypothetical protein
MVCQDFSAKPSHMELGYGGVPGDGDDGEGMKEGSFQEASWI